MARLGHPGALYFHRDLRPEAESSFRLEQLRLYRELRRAMYRSWWSAMSRAHPFWVPPFANSLWSARENVRRSISAANLDWCPIGARLRRRRPHSVLFCPWPKFELLRP